MRDPREGVGPDGMIRTGVDRSRVPRTFEPVVAALVAAVSGSVPLLRYGSVATGAARSPGSDVDAVTVGLPAAEAAAIGAGLSRQFADVCRGVEIGAAQPEGHLGDGDEAYGNRVFLRHYCLLLAGPDPATGWGPFPADVRAARGFNGDIAAHLARWRTDRDATDPALLGRRVARKTLLAVAGLVSVYDRVWTTDRVGAARRWAQLHPAWSDELNALVHWSEGGSAGRDELRRVLDDPRSVVPAVVSAFAAQIGLWGP